MEFLESIFDGVSKGDNKALMCALECKKSAETVDKQGRTVLHWCAASEESERLVPELIMSGAKVDALDNQGRTPLHYFAAKGRLYGAACLLHHGANPNVPATNDNSTPLHYAVALGNDDVVRLLLAYGAIPSTLNSQGYSSYDLNRSNVNL